MNVKPTPKKLTILIGQIGSLLSNKEWRDFAEQSNLNYESVIAFNLGAETALTIDDGSTLNEIENPRFTKKLSGRIKQLSKALRRRKNTPTKNKKIKASRRWGKARKQISKPQRKVANQCQDWQPKVRSDIASRKISKWERRQ